jgi:hypothetical protein
MKYELLLKDADRAIERSSVKPNAGSPAALKSKMAELMLNLMRRRKKFGMFVILGWKAKWQRYADTPDASQDIFARHHINIMKLKPTARAKNDGNGGMVSTINFDGAILIDGRGNVLHSGAMIEGLRPRATAHKLNPHRAADLSAQFGFKRKVHMRHIAAITSSYLFKGTTVFTISEETDDLHIFEDGRIIYSTVRGEQMK